jgi:hypothetical protein
VIFSEILSLNFPDSTRLNIKSQSPQRNCQTLKPLINGFIFLLLTISVLYSSAQNDSVRIRDTSKVNKKLLAGIVASEAVVYAGSFTGLYFLWYKNYPQSGFHFFDDGKEWMQMDKMGHVTSNYYIAKGCYSLLRMTGLSDNKSIIYGTLTVLLYLLRNNYYGKSKG